MQCDFHQDHFSYFNKLHVRMSGDRTHPIEIDTRWEPDR